MDKNAIKKYAVWARRELITRVSQRAGLYEITAEGCGDPKAESVRGRVLSDTEKSQRAELVRQIQKKGFEQVMEEVAYTWFNRFAALRFMEVNGSLPSRVRVFTDAENNFKPQILTEAIDLELDGLDRQKVYQLKNDNDDEALFKYLIITQCNALNSILPVMFQRINDCTELLFPENLLREGSVIEQMVTMIPEEDWTDQVQIIGWLYQYYNTEPKDKVFANLKKNIKITKENIPAATQLFTPDWIVHYMVENSLGRLWLEGHPAAADKFLPAKNPDGSVRMEKERWNYYLEEAEQEPEVQQKLDELRREYADLKPEDIRVIDPCMGSGHILCVLFDTLMQIYEDYGYTARNAVTSILENNLWGLDIDQRAAQLAYFSVMMKAVQYDGRLFRRRGKPVPQPHVYWPGEYAEGQEFGSLLVVKELEAEPELDDWDMFRGDFQAAHDRWAFRRALAQKYHVVVTNPPYMATSNLTADISNPLKKIFPDSKADLFAIFIERCKWMTFPNMFQAMITQHSWMFLSSYEKVRQKLKSIDTINLLHLGPRAFQDIGGEVVQTSAFVFRNIHIADCNGIYCRLIEPTTQQGKADLFLSGEMRFAAKQDNFAKIPGEPVAYWVSETVLSAFSEKPLSSYVDTRRGLQTGDSNRFIRFWYEVSENKMSFDWNRTAKKNNKKWYVFNSGGSFRKWYGNILNVVNWEHNGNEIKSTGKAIIPSEDRYFDVVASWNKVSSGRISVRYQNAGIIPGDASPYIHTFKYDTDIIKYAMGLLNSKVSAAFVQFISPTLNYEVGNIAKIPMIESSKEIIQTTVEKCIFLSRTDWDSFETSWDFQRHPLVRAETTVAAAFSDWETECSNRFHQLKSNEEQLNRIFIDLYGLQDELTPEVEDKDVTVRRADLQREIKSLISYAVGCMFGRYSLDKNGLVLAGQPYEHAFAYAVTPVAGGGFLDTCSIPVIKDDKGKWNTCSFSPDSDNIIPICDDEYFADDIVGRFVEFLRVVYGEDTLEANLKYVADALGGKGTPKQVIRNYFLNDFYKDHCKIYQKRPIYWLFDSGKKNGFKCLIYLHRYQPDTIARIRTDYVHEQQSRYRTAIADLERRSGEGSASDRVKVKKTLERVTAQAEELRVYEEKIHHLADQMIAIDLDDGVKKNYEIFKDVLAKIR